MAMKMNPDDCLHVRTEVRGCAETCLDCGAGRLRDLGAAFPPWAEGGKLKVMSSRVKETKPLVEAVAAISYVPKPIPIDAIKWNKPGDHPSVKYLIPPGEQKGGDFLVQPDVEPCPVARGDYIVGPDSCDNLIVFDGASFEAQYEPQIIRTERKVTFVPSRYHINMLSTMAFWLKRMSTETWARSTGHSGEMKQYERFCEQVSQEMENSLK
jgi:hypothetical protein